MINAKLNINIASILLLLLSSCSGSDFASSGKSGASGSNKSDSSGDSDGDGPDSGGADGDSDGDSGSGSDADGGAGDSGDSNGDSDTGGSDELSSDEVSVTRTTFNGPSQTLMFRGTRGADVKKMQVGIYLNQADEAILQASKGKFVVSGLRTGAFNDWGLFVKSVSPVVTSSATTTRSLSCDDDEVVVGLPDVGVDANQSQGAIIDTWKNRYVCAKVKSPYELGEKKDVNYTHSTNISVDCPDDYLMTAYNCGTCGVPSPAILSCRRIKKN